jgi:protein pelota
LRCEQMGQYHTFELSLHHPFSVSKPHAWDSLYLARIAEACDPSLSSDVGAVVMQPGLAHVMLVGGSMTVVKAKVDISIPRKRVGASSGHDKALVRFYEAVADAIVKHVNFAVVKCLIVASPGFLKDDFLKWLMAEATKRDWSSVLENKAKIVAAHCASGFKHALKEVLSDATVGAKY